jgi:hypothetical protein
MHTQRQVANAVDGVNSRVVGIRSFVLPLGSEHNHLRIPNDPPTPLPHHQKMHCKKHQAPRAILCLDLSKFEWRERVDGVHSINQIILVF